MNMHRINEKTMLDTVKYNTIMDSLKLNNNPRLHCTVCL